MTILDRIFPRRFVARSLAEHLGTPWAMDASAMARTVREARARLDATDASTIRSLATGDASSRPMLGGLAEAGVYWIPVNGAIIRGDASCARMMGISATGLEEIERALAYAESAPDVTSIEFAVDSPGGTAVGVQEIVDLIAAIKAKKPVRAEIAGQCASAAYWLISQCTEITAERSALVGSIGVFSVIEDSSKASEAEGVTVHVIRSGVQKGAGTEGAPVAPEHLAAQQVVVDDLAALFTESVRAGRGLTTEGASALATGEVWIASKALAAGLIDRFTGAETSAEFEPPMPPGPVEIDTDDGEAPGNTIDGAVSASIATAPQGAEVQSMDELKKLQAELDAARGQLAAADKAKAENEALKASISEIRSGQRAAVIEKHAAAGRVTPGMRAQIEAMALKNYAEDPAGLDAFLSALPVQTRSQPSGGAQERPAQDVADADLKARAAKANKLTDAQAAEIGNVVSVSFDGSAKLADGRVLAPGGR